MNPLHNPIHLLPPHTVFKPDPMGIYALPAVDFILNSQTMRTVDVLWIPL